MENASIETEIIEKPKQKKLNSSTYALLTTHGFNEIVSIFVSTFLISYIYSISTNYVLNIGLFYCFNYLTMGFVIYFVSKLIDKTNRVICYRIAIIVRALFILAVVFLGKDLAKVVILAGMFHGFSEAWYWGSFNVMKNELVPNACVKQYSTIQVVQGKAISFFVPIILGTIIDAESFKLSGIIILVLATIQVVVSFFIKSKKPEGSDFNLKEFLQDTKSSEKNKEIFKICFIATAMFGLTSVISHVNTIIIMLTFKSNFSLGLLTGVFSAVSIFMLILAKKVFKPGKTSPLYLTCAIVSILSTLLVVFLTQKVTIIIFNFVYIAVSTFNSYYYDLFRNLILKNLGLYKDIAEYQCTIEVVMEVSRVIGFAIMILTGLIGWWLGGNGIIVALKAYFVLAIINYAALHLVFMKFEKVLKKYDILKW